jgi:hypothetical protein
MAKPTYIKGKDGKMVGSIGAGKNAVPKAPITPNALQRTIKDPKNIVVPKYDAPKELARLESAIEPADGFVARGRQKRARRKLEAKFGKIDWTKTDMSAFETPRIEGLSLEDMQALDGQTVDNVWVRIADRGDDQFEKFGDQILVTFIESEYLEDTLEEFSYKPHVFLEPTTPGIVMSRRVHIGDLLLG